MEAEKGMHRFELGVWSLGLMRMRMHAQITRHSDDYLLLSTGSLACPANSCCPTTLDQHQELGTHQDGLMIYMKYRPCMVNKPYLLVHFQHD